MNCHVGKVGFQFPISSLLNSHMRMAAPIAYRVASELDRHFSRIANELPLLLKELVAAGRREKNEVSLKADVLNVCETRRLPSCSRRLPDPEPVLLNELLVDQTWIFLLWNLSGHVEEVSTTDVGHGELLNEPGD